MPRYRCVFHGRKLGAIGVFGFHVVELDAEDPESARLKCYETHEHISNFKAIEVK